MNTPFSTWSSHPLLPLVVVAGVLYVAGQFVGAWPENLAAQEAQRKELTVQGRGVATVQPDRAHLNFGVVTEPLPTADEATRALEQSLTRVIAAINDNGVAEEDITTASLSVNPQYDFDNGRQTLRGYVAQESVKVRVRDTKTVGSIVSSATAAGANQVGGVEFDNEDPTAMQLSAQQNAIADARERADALADSLGVELGEVVRFDVLSDGQGPVPLYNTRATEDSAAALPVPVGTQDVEAGVSVTFSFSK